LNMYDGGMAIAARIFSGVMGFKALAKLF
jgi:hypothetical protein